MTKTTSTGKQVKNMKRRLIEIRGGESEESFESGAAMNTPEGFVVGSKHLVYHRERFPCKFASCRFEKLICVCFVFRHG
jgi:hypothetical protein